MTEHDVVLDKLLGVVYTASQSISALEAIYPIHKVFALNGDLCRRAYKHLTRAFHMQSDDFFSGGEPFPVSALWWTVKTSTQAVMFQLSSINTMRLYVYAHTQEALDEITQELRKTNHI